MKEALLWNRDGITTTIRIQLPEAETQRLEQAFRSVNDRKLRDRLNVICLVQRGRRHQDIADEVGMSTRSVQRWLNAYLERGPPVLPPRSPRLWATRSVAG